MPTENELKYVLSLDLGKQIYNSKIPLSDPLVIRQGYLHNDIGGGVRVRSIINGTKMLNVKWRVPDRIVEVETEITTRDFEDLFAQCKERLDKHRYIYSHWHHDEELIWEIDLFFTNQNGYSTLYFVLAEHEMPEGQENPVTIPSLVLEHLVYAVPREETGEFSSRKLSDPHYASGRYTALTQKEVGSC